MKIYLWVFLGLVLAFQQASAETKDEQLGALVRVNKDVEGPLANVYGSVELRHHLNTYYDAKDYRGEQEPAVHARLKLGASFREGLIDAYATFGLLKKSQTQQVMQRRPEFEVDLYPVSGTYGRIIQYTIVQLAQPNAEEAADEERTVDAEEQASTAYTLGFAPTLLLPLNLNDTALTLKGGFDYWTKLYGRRQYQDDRDEKEDKFALSEEGSAEQGEEQEDTALHYYSLYMLGAALSPAWARSFETEIAGFFDVRYVPQYQKSEKGGSELDRYSAEKSSYYRWRIKYELSERASLINDFYHFHQGFFAEKADGGTRRFRNVARLTYAL